MDGESYKNAQYTTVELSINSIDTFIEYVERTVYVKIKPSGLSDLPMSCNYHLYVGPTYRLVHIEHYSFSGYRSLAYTKALYTLLLPVHNKYATKKKN